MNRTILIAFLFLNFGLSGFGQTPMEVMEKIIQAYQTKETLSYYGKYKYFENLTSTKPTDSLESYIVMSDYNMYFKIADYEIVGGKDYSVFTDNKKKQIVLETRQESEGRKKDLNFLSNLLTTTGASVSAYKNDNSINAITIEYTNQSITRIDVFYNRSNYYVEKCIIRYLDHIDSKSGQPVFVRLEIEYFNFVKTEKAVAPEYTISKYIQLNKNKTFSVQNTYAKYSLVNLTELKKI